MSETGFVTKETRVDVVVPWDGEARYAYVDALGESVPDAVSHFTRYGRFDLTLSEIFHMDYLPAVLETGGLVALRSDVVPLVVPVSDGGELLVMAASYTKDECLRLMKIFEVDPAGYGFAAAGLKVEPGATATAG